MFARIKMFNTAEAIGRCWVAAETQTREVISQKYWGPGEESITFLFSGELRSAIEEASRNRDFERAFAADLTKAYPQLRLEIEEAASGLVGVVNFHGRQHESTKSAADLGIVLVQPDVEMSWPTGLRIRSDAKRALLAQAKLRSNHRNRWGGLTKRQLQLFPQRAPYTTLLLYRLFGKNANELDCFSWQSCAGALTGDVRTWLRTGQFPSACDSESIITALSEGRLGTEDPKVCHDLANPATPAGRSIELRLSWPNRPFPAYDVVLQQAWTHASQQIRQPL